MFTKIINLFDKLEDKARSRLSKFPVLYALIGGVGIVLFWHSVTEIALAFPVMNTFHALPWFIVSLILLLLSGIFVSYFVGDQIIISGIRGEKKMIEKTKEEIDKEEDELIVIAEKIDHLTTVIKSLEEKINRS